MAERQMAPENERESEEERKKEEKDHQYFEDLKQQIEGNAIRRKADHDLEERRAQTEFDEDEAWLAEHAAQLIGHSQAGVVERDDWPIGRKGVDSRYTTHHTNFQTKRQMVIEDERESEQERKKEEKDHQYFDDLKQQIAGNVVRRKAEHDVEMRRAKTEFSGGFEDEACLAEEAEERKNIDKEHAPPPIGHSQAGIVERDDWPIGRKGVDSRYTTHHTNFQTKRQMVIEDERESEQERKKEEKDHQYFDDLKQQIAGNVVRRKAEHDVEERRAKTEDESWLAKEAEERKHIVEEHSQAGVVKHDDLPVERKGAGDREDFSDRPHRFANRNDQREAERLEGVREREEERKKEERNHQHFEDLKQQIEGNAIWRKADHGLEERRAQTEFDQDEAWLAEEAEERKNIDEEHAPPPIGYSQAGVVERDNWPIGRKGVDSRYTTHHTNFQTKRQMVIEDERESEQERKKEEKDHQYLEDLKQQIGGNVVRRKAEHDVEVRRAKTEFGGEFDDESWLAKEAEERKHIVEHSQAGVVKHDDLPVERKGADQREDFSDRPHRFASRNDQREAEKQMAFEDEKQRVEKRKTGEKDHQYLEDLKQQIAGNVVRRKAEHDVEERRAKTEFSGEFDDEAWLAEHAPPPNGDSQAGVVERDDWPIGRKGVDSRYTTHHTNFQTKRQMVIEDERESEEERKKDEKDHQYLEDLKQQIGGNVVRRKAEHDVEERRAKTEFSGEFDDESWLAVEAEERKNIVE